MAQKHQFIIVKGRGHEADIRITDISVSRQHAILRYENGKFLIEDKNSKFGTLVLLKHPFPINFQNNNLAIQVNRTILQFNIKKKWSITPACFRKNQNEELSDDEISSHKDLTRAVSNQQININEPQQIQQQQELEALNNLLNNNIEVNSDEQEDSQSESDSEQNNAQEEHKVNGGSEQQAIQTSQQQQLMNQQQGQNYENSMMDDNLIQFPSTNIIQMEPTASQYN